MKHPNLAIVISLLIALPFSFRGEAKGSPVRFTLAQKPQTLDWNLAETTAETYLLVNVMEGLLEENERGEVQARLAEKWELSSDQKTYTFHLRKSAKWSDGKPVLSQHFIDSWMRLLSPALKSSQASLLLGVKGAAAFAQGKSKRVEGLNRIDDFTFQVELERPVSHFLNLLSFWPCFPIRKDQVSKMKEGNAAVTGPFLLKKLSESEMELSENPFYWDRGSLQAQGQTFRVRIESSPAESQAALKSGDSDFLIAPSVDAYPTLTQARSDLELTQFPYFSTFYMAFPPQSSLRTLELRKSLVSLLDRSALPLTLRGGQKLAQSFVPPGMGLYRPPVYLPLEYRKAEAAFQEWKRQNEKSMEGEASASLQRKVLRIGLVQFEGGERVSEALSSALGRVGVPVELKTLSPQELKRRVNEFDAVLRQWGADYSEPSTFLEIFTSGHTSNPIQWEDSRYDQWMQQARDATDLDKRNFLYSQAELYLVETSARVIPLFHPILRVLRKREIQGLYLSPLNYLYLKRVRRTQSP